MAGYFIVVFFRPYISQNFKDNGINFANKTKTNKNKYKINN